MLGRDAFSGLSEFSVLSGSSGGGTVQPHGLAGSARDQPFGIETSKDD